MTYQVLLLPSRLGSAKPSVKPFVCKSKVASSSYWKSVGDTHTFALVLWFVLIVSLNGKFFSREMVVVK